MASAALLQRLAKLNQRWLVLEDVFIPDDQRVGLDSIRNKEDLGICIEFMIAVCREGRSEAVWAAEHPREYERLQWIAGTVPVTK